MESTKTDAAGSASETTEDRFVGSRWPRHCLKIAAALVAIVVGGELVARFGLGIGDPPLWQDDPQLEYVMQPNQTGSQLKKAYRYNAYSMRSQDFGLHKSNPHEFRVMVFGDSVVNGGNQTDQSDLATEVLQAKLAHRMNRPVVVGNISCGSWGPPNLLAYARKFGLFDADVVVIVVSTHDAADVPTFQKVAGTKAYYPDRKPLCALQEAVTRYLPNLWRAQGDPAPPADTSVAVVEEVGAAMRELIAMAQASGARVVVVLHWERAEQTAGASGRGLAYLRDVSLAAGAIVRDDGGRMRQSLQSGDSPYRDNIHPNEAGHRVLAEIMADAIAPAADNAAPAVSRD
jgi:hypothetical protein